MKKFITSLLMILVASLAYPQERSLMLTYQGNSFYMGYGLQSQDLPFIRERMGNLIKQGYTPILIEGDWEIIWLYINNPHNPVDYIDMDFESEYSEAISDLFPIKTNRKLKRALKKWWNNKRVLEILGIKYQVENDEVISVINYKKFERYL